MTYNLLNDKTSKSAEIELNNETIITFFATEDAESGLPELIDGVYGAAGVGPMGPDWAPIGGGGSSDFSVAEMTVSENGDDVSLTIPFIDESVPEHTYIFMGTNTFEAGNTYKLPIYNEGLMVMLENNPVLSSCTISGDAALTEYGLAISGDFTITNGS